MIYVGFLKMLVALYCFLNYILFFVAKKLYSFFKTSQDKDVDLFSMLLFTEDLKDIDTVHGLNIRNLQNPSPILGFMCLVSEQIYPV
jgi:hypothetical protein